MCRLAAVVMACVVSGAIAAAQVNGRGADVARLPPNIWHVAGDGRGLPAAEASTAYFLSAQHEVLAINADNGALRWRQSTGEPGDTTFGSALVIAGPVVVAGDYNLVAFDRSRGVIRWRFAPTEGYGPGIYLGAAADGRVFAGSPAGRLYAVDEVTGLERWTTVVSTDGKTTVFQPVVRGGIVAAGYTTFSAPNAGGVICIDAATGRVRWRTTFSRASNSGLGSGWAGGPLFIDDVVVAASSDGTIYGFSSSDGSVRWSIPKLGGSSGTDTLAQDFRPLTRAGAALVAGSLSGSVVAYDIETRRELWRHATPNSGSTAFAIASDRDAVYVPYVGGRLVALSLANGEERWRVGDANTQFPWPPLVFGDRIYVAASKAGFFALRK